VAAPTSSPSGVAWCARQHPHRRAEAPQRPQPSGGHGSLKSLFQQTASKDKRANQICTWKKKKKKGKHLTLDNHKLNNLMTMLSNAERHKQMPVYGRRNIRYYMRGV